MQRGRGPTGGLPGRRRRRADPHHPGSRDRVDIAFLDATGRDLSAAQQRRLERLYSRLEFRRAFPGEIGDLTFSPQAGESYVRQVLGSIDNSGLPSGPDARMKVVVDAGNGAAGLLLPGLVGGWASTC